VVSTISNSVFDAMNAGAVDFVTKPDVQSVTSVQTFIKNLIIKIKVAATAKVSNINNNISSGRITEGSISSYKRDIIAIGASTGGTEAIYALLKGMSNNLPGIVIVQHIPPIFSKMFSERLNDTTDFQVKEAESGDFVQPGKVLIAPGDKHMKIKKLGDKYKIECFEGEKVSGHCPSVDILFDSIANAAGKNSIGIILTGMGYDGAKGLLNMRKKGARTIGQDEKSSVVYGMPKVAFEIGAVEKQTTLTNIPNVVHTFLNESEARRL
jgi:two-component system chemotaxis response regulator CheB